MPKEKTVFACNQCGYKTSKWIGRCLDCGQYNTLEEIVVTTTKSAKQRLSGLPTKLSEVSAFSEDKNQRMATGLSELDNVLSGGIVEGTLMLLGGDPGIGKSTLLLQICRHLDACGHTCLYVSGEESASQIKMRADRLKVHTKHAYILPETDIETILGAIDRIKPSLVMIDSIQTMVSSNISSAPGSVVQVRECTLQLMRAAKESSTAVMIVGHVTKEGTLAGPRMLEHMVDTVLYFEGERRERYRLIRAVKNRFGSTNEIGVFEMCEEGLREIDNPSAYMLAGRPLNVSGSAVTCCLEGTRPILAEVQALCSYTQFGNPRRTATGMDYNRVVMLMAVLEKRAGYKLATYDSYVNVAGGMKIMEPAADGAVVAALASSYKNKPINPYCLVFGEVGLTGELRAVTMAERRIAEANKLGFTQCIVPQTHLKGLRIPGSMEIYGASNIGELLQLLL
ncbi:MAG: DNA repair protein RadA [Defluviitaleaceae bacterium]|nr:DNA repair protein RadA [Defluviitaleaceae bacterium]